MCVCVCARRHACAQTVSSQCMSICKWTCMQRSRTSTQSFRQIERKREMYLHISIYMHMRVQLLWMVWHLRLVLATLLNCSRSDSLQRKPGESAIAGTPMVRVSCCSSWKQHKLVTIIVKCSPADAFFQHVPHNERSLSSGWSSLLGNASQGRSILTKLEPFHVQLLLVLKPDHCLSNFISLRLLLNVARYILIGDDRPAPEVLKEFQPVDP